MKTVTHNNTQDNYPDQKNSLRSTCVLSVFYYDTRVNLIPPYPYLAFTFLHTFAILQTFLCLGRDL